MDGRMMPRHPAKPLGLNAAYLPVGVVAGVDAQDAADLHVGEALLQHLHHVQNAQSSAERDLVEHLMKKQRDKEYQGVNSKSCTEKREVLLFLSFFCFVGLAEMTASNALWLSDSSRM